MNADLPEFQRYQLQFTSHIRNPILNKKPSRVVAARMRVYTEIVFNNLESSVSACFPVSKRVLGKRAWGKLVRGFFSDYRSHSPLFRQIPEEFLRYLDQLDSHTLQAYPLFLKELAHYEWIELALSVADVVIDSAEYDVAGDLLESRPVFSPALALLSYHYPVQRISPRFKPGTPLAQPVNLLVFRDLQDQVEFIEINAVTARLLGILQADAVSGKQALEKLAVELAHPEPQAIIQYGRAILDDLRAQGAILGTGK